MKISIFGGAGTVGSCTAFTIACQGLANELVLLDVNKDLLNNHVLDIRTAVSTRSRITIHAGQNEDISGTNIAIIAAGMNFPASTPADERMSHNLPVILETGKALEKYCPSAIVITATNPVDLFNYALYVATRIDAGKLIGYNLNDSIRFRIAAASVLRIDSYLVDGYVFGEHPTGQVMLFSSLKAGGKAVDVDTDFRNRVVKQIQNYLKHLGASLARTAGWTTAAGLADMVRAIEENSNRDLPCSVIVNGEYGYKSISIGLSAVLGQQGIKRISKLEILPGERNKLDQAAASLEKGANRIRQAIGPEHCTR